jgi:membrane associated rhomboid family serine protease
MSGDRTFMDELKRHYREGGMTIKLIFLNGMVFLFLGLLTVAGKLMLGQTESFTDSVISNVFTLDITPSGFIQKPWGLITSIFSHLGFFHLLFNMLLLYFSGKMFESLFDQRRLLTTYLLGGIAGGLFEIFAHATFTVFSGSQTPVIGASGAVIALFIAVAFYRPNTEVRFFNLFPIKLIYLALVLVLLNLFSLGNDDQTAHFAHIGGAIIGILSLQKLNSKRNIVTLVQNTFLSIISFLKKFVKKKEVKLKFEQGGSGRGNVKTDEEFNYERKQRQIIVDEILDKIAKSGYESLSKKEKEFLFDQSKK